MPKAEQGQGGLSLTPKSGSQKRGEKKGFDIRIKAGWQAKVADGYYHVLLLELGGKSFVFNFSNN